jgi:hypothetical protein
LSAIILKLRTTNLKEKYITFIIEKDGRRHKNIRDIGYGTGERSYSCFENMPEMDSWKMNGEPVR